MINIDPYIKKLEVLKEYMGLRIDNWANARLRYDNTIFLIRECGVIPYYPPRRIEIPDTFIKYYHLKIDEVLRRNAEDKLIFGELSH